MSFVKYSAPGYTPLLTSNSSIDNLNSSPLVRLPPELRNMVYGHLFTGHRIVLDKEPSSGTFPLVKAYVIEGDQSIQSTQFQNHHVHHFLALSETCRQLREEVGDLPLVYSTISTRFNNLFYGFDKLSCIKLLKVEKLEVITSIHIDMNNSDFFVSRAGRRAESRIRFFGFDHLNWKPLKVENLLDRLPRLKTVLLDDDVRVPNRFRRVQDDYIRCMRLACSRRDIKFCLRNGQDNQTI